MLRSASWRPMGLTGFLSQGIARKIWSTCNESADQPETARNGISRWESLLASSLQPVSAGLTSMTAASGLFELSHALAKVQSAKVAAEQPAAVIIPS